MTSDRIIDLGAGGSPDTRATETTDIRENADTDHHFDLGSEWPFKDASVHGLVANHSFEHLTDVAHAIAEAGRVLIDDGWLEITVPLGENARTDPDHKQFWTYTTPEVYCIEQQRPWDPPTSLKLVDRTLDVWFLPPFDEYNTEFQEMAEDHPNWAAYRCGAGELTARYMRIPR